MCIRDSNERTATAEFAALLGPAGVPGSLVGQPGHRYRLTLSALLPGEDGGDVKLSTTSIEVTLGATTPVAPARVTLSPTLGAVSIVNGTTLQLRTSFMPAGSSAPSAAQDVTSSGDTCYR